jgi:hypothetical protein
LTILAAACPRRPRAELAQLLIGERNLLLLTERRRCFGGTVEGDANCTRCGQRLAVTVELPTVTVAAAAARRDGDLRVDGVSLSFRLPTSADIEVAAAGDDAREAARLLLRRCVIRAERAGAPVDVDDLPTGVIDALNAELGCRDPYGDIRLTVHCGDCGHDFDLPLDPGALLWAELEERALRLLTDVHRLASAYGWTEREILTLDPDRRAVYLELVP